MHKKSRKFYYSLAFVGKKKDRVAEFAFLIEALEAFDFQMQKVAKISSSILLELEGKNSFHVPICSISAVSQLKTHKESIKIVPIWDKSKRGYLCKRRGHDAQLGHSRSQCGSWAVSSCIPLRSWRHRASRPAFSRCNNNLLGTFPRDNCICPSRTFPRKWST